ncbi:SCO1664 family protein [Georgenia sp. Z1344]|uniref:SCO1664 family protein n=1 Tax=Georgenia sp. Z1344 TaxID=3416706 RepID=UPI003CE988B1
MTGPAGSAEPISATDLLLDGEISLLGQLADSSNETFLVEVAGAGDPVWAIYKPELGEAPLRDFPPGLYRRERAAYLLSEALGWHLVPRTVIREDAPFGVGSLQRFVEHDRSAHYFTLVDDDPATHDDLRRIAVFDALTNNTDRKSGHVLHGVDGRVWGIDHGLCFSATPKLRTVIWDFAGERIDADLLAAVAPVVSEVDEEIAALLDNDEVVALRRRALRLVTEGRLPVDLTGMAFPWPLV